MSRLNRALVESAVVPAGKDSLILWDSALPGFGVRVNKGQSRSYCVQYRSASGTTKRHSLGRYDAMPIDEARRLARSTIAKAMIGFDPVEEKAKARAKAAITLGSVADTYLEAVKPRLRPSTHAEATRYLEVHFEKLRQRPISAVQRADVATVLREIATTRGGVAANRGRASLSAFFAWALGEGVADHNPVVGTNKLADEVSRDHVLTPAELVAVWRACGDDDHGRIIRLLILTGQRRDEVGSIANGEIANTVWSIPATRTKNHRPHDVPLSPPALDILSAIPKRLGRDLVFGSRVGGFSGWSKGKAELDARIAANGHSVRPWRLHDLRRTAATGMADLGTLPHVIEAVLNHVSGHRAGVAGVYNRASYAAEKRIALETWAGHVTSLLSS